MNPREEFLRHAADCERMAKSASDGASQLAWKQMAERVASLRIENRKSAPGWSTCAAEKAPPECGPRLGASVNSDQRRGVWIPSAAAGVLILAPLYKFVA